jgi:hypothetical protein
MLADDGSLRDAGGNEAASGELLSPYLGGADGAGSVPPPATVSAELCDKAGRETPVAPAGAHDPGPARSPGLHQRQVCALPSG